MQKYKLLFHWTKIRGEQTVLANSIAVSQTCSYGNLKSTNKAKKFACLRKK